MSKKFIEFVVYPEKDPVFSLPKTPYIKNPICLTLPYFEEDKDSPCNGCIVLACCTKEKCDKFDRWRSGKHSQALIECWINLGIDIFQKFSNVEHPIGYNKKTGFPIKFIFLFKIICRLLGYVINCTSWEKKKLHNFDTDEFKHRIKQLNMF